MSLVTQLTAAFTRVGAEFKSVRTSIATKAASSTTITAGTGLTGGGDLTANRTLAVGASVVQSTTTTAPKLTVGTTAPTGPATGDLWVDTN